MGGRRAGVLLVLTAMVVLVTADAAAPGEASADGRMAAFRADGRLEEHMDEPPPDDAAPLGTIQGPIKTKFGHHLIKVVERSDS